MKYYKSIINSFITSTAKHDGNRWEINCVGDGLELTEITESEYNNLLSIIHNRPTAPTGFTYKLTADTLEWELVELPPMDESDEDATESDYIDALQDLGVEVDA